MDGRGSLARRSDAVAAFRWVFLASAPSRAGLRTSSRKRC